MAANLHLEHAEDLMLMMGRKGVDEAFEYIDDLTHTFSSAPKGNSKITTKWDGSPAIFCGYDPADGAFFVGKKSVFNKTPGMYKSEACLLYTSPSPRDQRGSRMPSSA